MDRLVILDARAFDTKGLERVWRRLTLGKRQVVSAFVEVSHDDVDGRRCGLPPNSRSDILSPLNQHSAVIAVA